MSLSVKAEPNRVMDLIRKGTMNGGFDATNTKFLAGGIQTSATKGTMGALCFFSTKYFKEYTGPEEDIDVVFTTELHKKLTNLKFGALDTLTLGINLTDKKFNIRGLNKDGEAKKRWNPKISGETVKAVKWTPARTAGIGMLPASDDPAKQPQNQMKVDLGTLILPEVDKINFRIREGKVTLEADFEGEYEQDVDVKESRKLDHDKVYTIFHEYVTNILANFKGDLWLTFYEKGIFFTQENADYTLTYYLATTA